MQLARRYKGTDAVIGFDLGNKPLLLSRRGGGGKKGRYAEATRLGDMLQAINSGSLIIVTGIMNPRPASEDAGLWSREKS